MTDYNRFLRWAWNWNSTAPKRRIWPKTHVRVRVSVPKPADDSGFSGWPVRACKRLMWWRNQTAAALGIIRRRRHQSRRANRRLAEPAPGKSVIDSRRGGGGCEGAAASRRTTGSGGRLIDLRALVANSGGTDNGA